MSMKPKINKVWGNLDEFGLLMGLGHFSEDGRKLEYVRYPGETNKQLKARILSATKDKGDSTLQGIVNELSRDLGISASGADIYKRYNVRSKKFFYLSEKPFPGPSGMAVYLSTSGSWSDSDAITPQIRASGFATATSGWIIWNQPDFNPLLVPPGLPGSSGWATARNETFDLTIRNGDNTQILEFIGDSAPTSAQRVRVDYAVQTDVNTLGQPVLNIRSDFSHPDDIDDERFVGFKSDVPSGVAYDAFASGHIVTHHLFDLKEGPASGVFYHDDGRAKDKLIKLKSILEDSNPLQWGRFRYDQARWDQLEQASIGNLPSFHDEVVPSGITSITVKNGVTYGDSLDMAGVQVISGNAGARDPWFPRLAPGQFYVGNTRHYLFGNIQTESITLTAVGDHLSGHITASGDEAPHRLLPMWGRITSAFSFNPFIHQVHDFYNPVSGLYYRAAQVNESGHLAPDSTAVFSGVVDLDLDGTQGFWFDYNNNDVYASGIDTQFTLMWEHKDVWASGTLITFSGGYGFTPPDLNPLNQAFNRVYHIIET